MILREIKNIFIKNRLTEGVDFVRKEWLKGDDTAYIEWRANLWNNQLHTVIGKEKKKFIVSHIEQNTTSSVLYLSYNPDNYLLVVFRSENSLYHIAEINPFSSMPDIVDFRFYIENNIGYCKQNGSKITGHNMATTWNDNVKFNIYGGKMKLLEEYDSVNDKLISSLVPCQLLKSIPSSLDANNIARQAGECGMYDSISGKFYGNVANSGTFTVEGDVEPETHSGLQQIYQKRLIEGVDYERYMYLEGTGGCYIDTLINPAWNDQLSATTKVSGRPTVPNPWILYADGTNTRVGMVLGGGWYKNDNPQFLVINRVFGPDDYIVWARFPANAELYASFKVVNNSIPTVLFKVNGVSQNNQYINGSNKITELPDTTYKIGNSTSGLNVLKLRNIKINSHNFIPCKLKCSILRNLDAQCKSRVAGECGMIDLISGKFYGNVANSGTFMVENDNNE